jgi:hypothetical protein
VRTTELTRSHRRRLTRHAHELARSGRYEGHAATSLKFGRIRTFTPPHTKVSSFCLNSISCVATPERDRGSSTASSRWKRHDEVGEGHGYEGLATAQAQCC